MSALFELGAGVVSHPVTLNQTLEIRNTLLTSNGTEWLNPFSSLSKNYMYTSTIELSMNGTPPAWSKDGWSFIPLETLGLKDVDLPKSLDSNLQADGSQFNISFTTQALRGRVKCTQLPAHVFEEVSNWLTPVNLTDHQEWDVSTIPHGIDKAYKLGRPFTSIRNPVEQISSYICPFDTSEFLNSILGCTPVSPAKAEIRCCKNGSSNEWSPSAAVGYWTVGHGANVIAKWVHGQSVSNIKGNPDNGYDNANELLFGFSEPPSIISMNCTPIIEWATADITVNPKSGKIQNFNVTGTAHTITNAFSGSMPVSSDDPSYNKMG